MKRINNREVTRRTDGEKTKAKIIAEAMRLTSEKGYNGVTSKEICEASGVNTALVSYYFGSRKKLHQEVLRRAHDQLFSMEEMQRIYALPISPEEKLKEFLSHLYRREKNSAVQQAIKIFLWEIRAPTDALALNLESTILPKFFILLQLASQISGLPVSSPELRKTLFFVLAPNIIALMFPSIFIKTIFKMEPGGEAFIEFLWSHALVILRQASSKSVLKKELLLVDKKEGEASPIGESQVQGRAIV